VIFSVERTAGLYAIVDVDAWRAQRIELSDAGVLERVTEAVLAAKPTAVQLRAKHEGGRATLELLRRMRPLCTKASVPLVANDRLDLALLAEVDAVHVGQDDLPIEDARRIAPSLAFGLSTHGDAQLDAALSKKPSYVAFGPVFATKSKEGADPAVGIERTAKAASIARAAKIPLVAIGGIDLEGATRLAGASVRWAAVISAIVTPDFAEVERRARALDRALKGQQP